MSEFQHTPAAVPSPIKHPNWLVENGLPLLVVGFLVLVLFGVGAVRHMQTDNFAIAVEAE